MLEKPNIADETIITHTARAYGLPTARVEFLPLGADVNTAVYRVTAEDGEPYFLKLRGGMFEPMSVLVPRFLRDQDIRQIIEPIRAMDGEPWSHLDRFTCVLYPYIEGRNAWAVELTDGSGLTLARRCERCSRLHFHLNSKIGFRLKPLRQNTAIR